MTETLDLREFRDLCTDLVTVEARVEPRARVATAGSLQLGAETAARFAPRLTGALAASIGWDLASDGLSGEFGPTVDYGGFVEFGTVNMAAQPYMAPAALVIEEPYAEAIADAGVESLL